MNKKYYTIVLSLALFFTENITAQILLSGDFYEAGSGSAVISYTKKAYTEFWAGQDEMTAPSNGLDQVILSLYARYALTDKIEAVAFIPYMSNTSKIGIVEDKSIQDVSIFVKGKLYEKQRLTAGVGIGANIASGYEAKSLYSLGNGATSFDGIVILNYETPIGVSISTQGGMSLKTGEVPNAALFMAKLSYAHSNFYVDVAYGMQRSTDGIDIGSFEFTGPNDFPKSKVNYDQLLFSIYVPVVDHIGLTAHFGTVLNGRNIGEAKYFGFGVAGNW